MTEKDGGGLTFSLTAPRSGTDNIAIDAALDRMNASSLFALYKAIRPGLNSGGAAQDTFLSETRSDVSGQIKITGIPKAMSGSADLRFGPGELGGEPLQSLVARATFNGSNVNIENVDARLVAGHFVASGTYNTSSNAFDLQGKADPALVGQVLEQKLKG